MGDGIILGTSDDDIVNTQGDEEYELEPKGVAKMAFRIRDGLTIGTQNVFNEGAELTLVKVRDIYSDFSTNFVHENRGGSDISLTENRNIIIPDKNGTLLLDSDMNDGTFSLEMGGAGLTNTTVTVGTGTGFSANSADNATYTLQVGPALTSLATIMDSVDTGLLRKSGENTYVIDGENYLTVENESADFQSFTLASEGDSTFAWAATGTVTSDAVGSDLKIVAGEGILTDVDDGNKAIRITHADTSSVETLIDSEDRTYVTGLVFDQFGHVTGVSTGQETDLTTLYTLSTIDDANDDIKTIQLIGTAGGTEVANETVNIEIVKPAGVTEPGLIIDRDDVNQSIQIGHADTSDIEDLAYNTGIVLKNLTFDDYGHVLTAQSKNLDDRYYTKTLTDSNFVAVAGDSMTGHLTLSGAPTEINHAANKGYVDGVAQGLKARTAAWVLVDTPLNGTYDGTELTFTAAAAGEFPTTDGVTTLNQVGARMLLTAQEDATQNGLYVLETAGDGSTSWVLRRDPTVSTSEQVPGSFVFIQKGNEYKSTGWVAVVDQPSTFVLNTSTIGFAQFSGAGTYDAGTGLTLSGTTFSHSDTAPDLDEQSETDVSADGKSYINKLHLVFDTFGHVTSIETGTGTVEYNAGMLDLAIDATAGASGSSVTVQTGTGFDADSADNHTYTLRVGPSLDALATTMADDVATGFLKKDGVDSYVLDDNTYLTADTGVESFSGGDTGLTPAAATNGVVTLDGVLNVAHGGTGITAVTTDQLLIGNASGELEAVTLTAGTGIVITNTSGVLTIDNDAVNVDRDQWIQDENVLDETHYISFVSSLDPEATEGEGKEGFISSDKLTWNPGTGTLYAERVETKDGLTLQDGDTDVATTDVGSGSANTTTATVIDTWDATLYRSAKYIIQVSQGTDYQVSEMLLVHNGTGVFSTEYAIVETNIPLATFSAAIVGGSVEFSVTLENAGEADVRIAKTMLFDVAVV